MPKKLLVLTKEMIRKHKQATGKAEKDPKAYRVRRPEIHPDYKVEKRSKTVNELDDIMWNPNGQIQVRCMQASMDLIGTDFGEYANLTLTQHQSTAVEYQTCVHLPTKTEVPNCRGKNAQYYHGFRAATLGKQLSQMKLDYTRVSHWNLIHHFLAGYRQAFAFMHAELLDEPTMTAEEPYGLGLLKADEDIDNQRVDKQRYRIGQGSPADQLLAQGYLDYVTAVYSIRPQGELQL